MDPDFASPPPSWRPAWKMEEEGPYLDSDDMYHDLECDVDDPKCPDPAHHTLMQLHKLVGDHEWEGGRGNIRTPDGRTIRRPTTCRVCGEPG